MTTPFDIDQGTIRILRSDSSARDLDRRYAVLVDGKIVASLKRGDAVAIPVRAGRHTVQLSIDWQESPAMEVEVARGEVVSLHARPRGSFQLWQAFVRSDHRVALERAI